MTSMEADCHIFLINLVYWKIYVIYLVYQIFNTDVLGRKTGGLPSMILFKKIHTCDVKKNC